MELKGKHVGLAVTGFFCTFIKIEQEVRYLGEIGAILHPTFSGSVQSTGSHFGDTDEFMDQTTAVMEMRPILKTEEVEPVGPRGYLNVLLIAPCTDSTLAKLVNGITDTSALVVAKVHLRNGKPLAISVSTNGALGVSPKNIGLLLNTKDIYFVLFGQDDPVKRPTSMTIRTGPIENTPKEALENRQIQPVIQEV